MLDCVLTTRAKKIYEQLENYIIHKFHPRLPFISPILCNTAKEKVGILETIRNKQWFDEECSE